MEGDPPLLDTNIDMGVSGLLALTDGAVVVDRRRKNGKQPERKKDKTPKKN